MQNEQGGRIERGTISGLRRMGDKLQQEFLRPQGGRQVGVVGAQLGLLLESARAALHPGESLWSVLEAQRQFLLKDGQVRSSALLVQALMATQAHAITDAALRETVMGLQAGLKAAQAESPERLELEVNHVAEMIVRSQRNELPLQSLLTKTPAQAVAGRLDQVHLLLDAETRRALLATATELLNAQGLTPSLKANLELIQGALTQPSLTPEQSAQLQGLLELAALPEGSLLATTVGEDVSKYVGSVVTGRAEVQKLKQGTLSLEVAKPVVLNVFADSEQAIAGIATATRPVSYLNYTGKLPMSVKEAGNFYQDVARHLAGDNEIFGPHLGTQNALAQAYYQWRQDPSRANNQQMARVGIRMMKYYARQLESNRLSQKGYD